MTPDPARARARTDLPFLRTRSARDLRPAPAVTAPARPAATSSSLGLSGDPVAPRPAGPPTPAPASPAARSGLDLSTPPGGLGLDLDAPSSAPPAPAAPAFSGSLLDLDGPDEATSPPAPSAASMPHAPGAVRTPARPGPNPVGSTSTTERPLGPRFPANRRLVLTPSAPTVAVDRLGSAIGTLTVTAAISAEVGEVQLGCAYYLGSGSTSFLNPDSGKRQVPAASPLPLLVGGRGRYPQISVDLRQVHAIERLLFVVHSTSGAPLTWGGTLILSTHGGDRAEIPLDPADAGAALAAASVYQVRGELVIRAELDAAASVREACLDYGYDAITWLDDRNPIG